MSFSNSLWQKITKEDPKNSPRFPFLLPSNSWMEFDQSKCSMRWYGQRETLVACVLFVSVLKTVKRPLLQTFKKGCKVRQLNVLVLFDYSSEIFKKLYHRANSCGELFFWSIEMHNGTLSSIYDEQASSIMKIVSVVNYYAKILYQKCLTETWTCFRTICTKYSLS